MEGAEMLTFLGQDLKVFQIEESFSINSSKKVSGTTGWTIWPSSYILLRLIEREKLFPLAELKKSSVCDLSAGLGLVGIALAKVGCHTTLTEVGEVQLEGLSRNIEENNTICKVKEYSWGSSIEQSFDIVFATDLLYIAIRDSIQDLLMKTIEELLIAKSVIIFSYQVRLPQEEEAFWVSLTSYIKKIYIQEIEIPFSEQEMWSILGEDSQDLLKNMFLEREDQEFKVMRLTVKP